ncbi:hypothetical protein CC1G_09277 [Coprinopsis cinerea okayama7|uniref:DUF6533 domain-containing protein n=1 Tax=Coprinopsis cinerea (strain Okayama-7 / 130 / ATCC MYA-4618 / FGSC 9003) TaxID=240176 RepID=A8N856_COPC7|nr:hypothetical protein CC1G_09277 [Coprinopsis cinerea okayama7\|eukprot:XP_001831012.2 hypothetical protein CC1G_09277 [Coprinopsis cinerea okayama7\
MALLPDLFNLNCVGMACIALVVYDYLCTLVDEVEYVWRSRWSIGIPLFFLNRYLVFVDQALLFHFSLQTTASPSTCGKLFQSGIWMLIFGGNVASFIIYMQTCAIWANQWKVVIPLLVLQLVSSVSLLVFRVIAERFQGETGHVTRFLASSMEHQHIYNRAWRVVCRDPYNVLSSIYLCHHLRDRSNYDRIYRRQGLSTHPGFQVVLSESDAGGVLGILYCICILVFSMSNAIISEALEGTISSHLLGTGDRNA